MTPSPLALDNDFWRFSSQVYAVDDVRGQCLELQDRYGVNVNLLLFAAWLDHRAIPLTDRNIGEIARLVEPWHDGVIRPLRSARRTAKAAATDEPVSVLHGRILQAELAAEQVEQAMLYRWAGSHTASATGATNNILTLLGAGAVPANAAESAAATMAAAIRQL